MLSTFLQSMAICKAFVIFSFLPSIPSHRKIVFDGWSSGQILASRKTSVRKVHVICQGIIPRPPPAIFESMSKTSWLQVWKVYLHTTVDYKLLQSLAFKCNLLLSPLFFFCQRTVRTIKYGVIRKYCWKVYSAQV